MQPTSAEPTAVWGSRTREQRPRDLSGSGLALVRQQPRERDESETRRDTAEPMKIADAVARPPAPTSVEPEYAALLAEHAQLVDRSFEDGLEARERRRLDLVRWHLSRIEADRWGNDLGALERLVAAQESLGGQIERLVAELDRHAVRRPRGR